MEKWLQAKKKHHYVWEYYLKKWAINGEVYWITPKGKIAHDSTKGMCRIQELYKINTLNSQDIEFIKAHIRPLSHDLQQIILKRLTESIEATNIINRLIRLEESGHGVKNEKESLLFNLLEDYYSNIELGARPAIDGLANDAPKILEVQQNLICLYSYIGHQITRTQGFKQRVFQSFEEEKHPTHSSKQFYRNLTEKNWWFISSYIFGYNMGYSLYKDRSKEPLIILKNTTTIPFITSDIPVINIYPDNFDLTNIPEFMDAYFPLSPQRALLISASDKWRFLEKGLSNDNVSMLNEKIARRAHSSIYGSSEESIKNYKHLLGT